MLRFFFLLTFCDRFELTTRDHMKDERKNYIMKTHMRLNILSTLTCLIVIGLSLTLLGCKSEEEPSTPGTPMVFELPELGYAYDALEPYIDRETMEVHHSKHHNSYVNNLNAALSLHPEIDMTIEEMLSDLSLVPKDIRSAVQNNGGGYYNHALYFSILKINHGQTPSGSLLVAIESSFNSYEAFVEEFKEAALTQFGSGWAWLIQTNSGLKVVQTSNQDVPFDEGTPILCIDVWEHAYYLHYQNRRADYVDAFFEIIDWDKVQVLYDAAQWYN